MSAPGVLAVMKRQAELTRRTGSSEDLLNLHQARAAVAELIASNRGCHDMLREAAKQFRLSGDTGHARHCDALADKAASAIAACGEQP